MHIWGPFHGGNEGGTADYYVGLDDAEVARMLRAFEEWKNKNREEADKLTITITSDNLNIGTDPSNLASPVSAVSLQSKDGDVTDKAVMHVHQRQGDMVVVQRVTESGGRLIQVSDR